MRIKHVIGLGSMLCFLCVFFLLGCESSAPQKKDPKKAEKEQKQNDAKVVDKNKQQPNNDQQVVENETNQDEMRLKELAEQKSIKNQERSLFVNHLLNNAEAKRSRHE